MDTIVVAPAKYGKFECIGRSCPDNCCRPSTWSITIDDESYDRYSKIEDDYKDYIMENLVKNAAGVWQVKPNEKGMCPFEAPDSLCTLYKRFGAEYLSKTCTSYPRKSPTFDNQYELSLSLSCPEAVRMLIFDRKGIQFDEKTNKAAEPIKEADNIEKAAFRMRALLFGIAMYKGMTVNDRLFYMGTFIKSAAKIPRDENYLSAVGEVVKTYLVNLYDTTILDEYHKNMETISLEYQKILFFVLVEEISKVLKKKTAPVNVEFYAKIEYFFENKEPIALDLPNTIKRLIEPYEKKNRYVFENYIFYNLYTTQFPKGEDNLENAFKEFVVEYLMMKIFIAALNHKSQTLRDTDVINCIYYFHRTLSHNAVVRKALQARFAKHSMGEMLSIV